MIYEYQRNNLYKKKILYTKKEFISFVICLTHSPFHIITAINFAIIKI